MGKMKGKYIDLMNLLEVIDRGGDAYCIWCDYEPLEPDYDKCPECKKENPIKRAGMI